MPTYGSKAAATRAAAQAAARASRASRAGGGPGSRSMFVTVTDRGQLGDISRRIRKHANAKALRRELTSGLRAEIKPLVPRVRAAYRANPSKGHASRAQQAQPSLRSLLAKATRTEVKLTGRTAGVRIRVDGRKMPAGMGRIPRYYEGTIARWKHPVFGRGDPSTWPTQRSHPTFFRTVRPWRGRIRRRMNKVLADISRKITKG